MKCNHIINYQVNITHRTSTDSLKCRVFDLDLRRMPGGKIIEVPAKNRSYGTSFPVSPSMIVTLLRTHGSRYRPRLFNVCKAAHA